MTAADEPAGAAVRSNCVQRIAMLAIAAPRWVIAVGVLVMLAAGIFGVPVAKSLSSSGFQDPTSESATAKQLLTDKFHQGDMQMLVTVTAADSATGAAARAAGTDIVDQLRRSPSVAGVTSAWTTPPAAAKLLVSKDGKTGLVVAGIGGGESAAQATARTLSDEITRDHPASTTGVIVRSGGDAMVNAQINSQLQHDLMLMESIAVPLSFLVLVWVFGGLLAAALPVAVGLMAILGSMAVLRLITFSTDVSNLAPNLSTAMGLALAIDYTLLIISRYRDELADGADPNTALIATMTTAGRTVLVSATIVALSMAAMMLFPMHVLKSFAYAGVATVAFAALAAIVVTPAAIVLLGDRLNALDVRRLARRLLRSRRATGGHRTDPVQGPIEAQFWYRSTTFVMRRAVPLGLAVVALLLVLGSPFLGVKWGFPDDRVLPTSASAHQVGDQLRNDFAENSATAVTAVIPDADGLTLADLERYAAELSRVPDVSAVSAPTGTFVAGARVGAALGGRRGSAGQRIPHHRQHRPTVLRYLADPTRPAACGARTGRPRGRTDGHRADQPRQRGRHHVTAARGAGADRGDHLRTVVPADRQRGAASQGIGAQRALADRRVRCAGVDLPGRAPGWARNDVHRNPARQHAGAVVLHRVRPVDGL